MPHKNLTVLLRGWRSFLREERPLLVFAGFGTDTGELPRLVDELGLGDDVRLLGAVAPDDLEALYAQADVLVTATLYEGFGLPVLEAMARGVLVACSDLPVLREVAGDDAELLDPARPRPRSQPRCGGCCPAAPSARAPARGRRAGAPLASHWAAAATQHAARCSTRRQRLGASVTTKTRLLNGLGVPASSVRGR